MIIEGEGCWISGIKYAQVSNGDTSDYIPLK